MPNHTSRREFLRRAALAGTAAVTTGVAIANESLAAAPKSPNEKLRIGVIGVAGRGGANLGGVAGEDIVALCDIDQQRLQQAGEKFPAAQRFQDARKLLELPNLDAVVVSTPDHTHFHPTYLALSRGLPVYCEKPLTHSVWEARKIRELTAEKKAITQMGTQIHAGDNYRRAVEIVQSGILGPVTRVHVWLGGGMKVFESAKTSEPPKSIDYDLWTGPAPLRPFSDAHFHFNWRYWWDFGNGALGDFGCHYMDLPHWALKLMSPDKVTAQGEKGHTGVNDCPLNLQVDYHFPARGELPPVHMTWYQGKLKPAEFQEYGGGKGSAVLFEGTQGRLLADYSSHKIFSEQPLQAPAASIPKSIGHHAEFLAAIRGGGSTTCNFDYSGALTESVLLGNVAYRLGNVTIDWDAAKLEARNQPGAAALIRREYRKGWELG